jgi:DNA-directed RNA polymerase subunit F
MLRSSGIHSSRWWCRLAAKGPPLLNSEVQEVLSERGAYGTDRFSRALPVEKHAAEYLTSVCKTVGKNDATILKCKAALAPFSLTSAEVFQILNLQPRTMVEVYLIVEELDSRYGDQADDTIEKILHVVQEHFGSA